MTDCVHKFTEFSLQENPGKFTADMREEALEGVKAAWLQEQNLIKEKISLTDSQGWDNLDEILVGGLDISFIVGDDVNACACYIVMNAEFKIVYQASSMVKMDAPYIPGFLAFREADHLAKLVEDQRKTKPEVTPSVIMMDGNGILHPNRAGLASHLGVMLRIPMVGVAKNLHMLPELGDISRKSIAQQLQQKGDTYRLETETDELLGMAVKTTSAGQNPVFVSVGSGLSIESAVKLVLHYSQYRIPEPTRQADMISREYLRINHPTARQLQPQKKKKETKR